MKRNKIFRIILNMAMTCLLIILMGYYITDNKVHEILGISLFILFVIHNVFNIKWYKNIGKGKFNSYRIFHSIINLLLLVVMLGMMISSIMISTNFLEFTKFSTTILGRKLHLLFNSWLFVLISIHIGLHLKPVVVKINNKMKNSPFEYAYYLFIVLFICFGVYSFLTNGLWKDMFLITEYKYFDYDKSSIIFYLEYLSILFGGSIITHLYLCLLRKTKKGKDERNE